jgi:hypothetical protein
MFHTRISRISTSKIIAFDRRISLPTRAAGYQLKDIEISPFAWPLELLKTIHGETTMGWTAFVTEMKDGTMYPYGTSFNFEFFDLPVRYSHSDIARIYSGMAYSKTAGLVAFSRKSVQETHPPREKQRNHFSLVICRPSTVSDSRDRSYSLAKHAFSLSSPPHASNN